MKMDPPDVNLHERVKEEEEESSASGKFVHVQAHELRKYPRLLRLFSELVAANSLIALTQTAEHSDGSSAQNPKALQS